MRIMIAVVSAAHVADVRSPFPNKKVSFLLPFEALSLEVPASRETKQK